MFFSGSCMEVCGCVSESDWLNMLWIVCGLDVMHLTVINSSIYSG